MSKYLEKWMHRASGNEIAVTISVVLMVSGWVLGELLIAGVRHVIGA